MHPPISPLQSFSRDVFASPSLCTPSHFGFFQQILRMCGDADAVMVFLPPRIRYWTKETFRFRSSHLKFPYSYLRHFSFLFNPPPENWSCPIEDGLSPALGSQRAPQPSFTPVTLANITIIEVQCLFPGLKNRARICGPRINSEMKFLFPHLFHGSTSHTSFFLESSFPPC